MRLLADTLCTGEVTDNDEREPVFHRQRLEIFDRFINSPALINIESNTICEEREVIKENDTAFFIEYVVFDC